MFPLFRLFEGGLALRRGAAPPLVLFTCLSFAVASSESNKGHRRCGTNAFSAFFVFDKEMCLRGALLACRVQPSYFISIISCYNLLILFQQPLIFLEEYLFLVATAMRTQTATERTN